MPQPYHAGSSPVLRPREDPRDRAQRREVAVGVGPARRARADLEQRQLVDRREPRKNATKPASSRPARGSARPPRRRARRAARALSVGPAPARSGNAASSVAASAASRLRCASPGQAVLGRDRLALLGQLQPSRRMAGRLREDRGVRGPPPRPALPPRPWKTSARHRARAPARRAPPARGRSPTGRRGTRRPCPSRSSRPSPRARRALDDAPRSAVVEQLLDDRRRRAQVVDVSKSGTTESGSCRQVERRGEHVVGGCACPRR